MDDNDVVLIVLYKLDYNHLEGASYTINGEVKTKRCLIFSAGHFGIKLFGAQSLFCLKA